MPHGYSKKLSVAGDRLHLVLPPGDLPIFRPNPGHRRADFAGERGPVLAGRPPGRCGDDQRRRPAPSKVRRRIIPVSRGPGRSAHMPLSASVI